MYMHAHMEKQVPVFILCSARQMGIYITFSCRFINVRKLRLNASEISNPKLAKLEHICKVVR